MGRLRDFRAEQSRHFDESFAYRFACKLRDFGIDVLNVAERLRMNAHVVDRQTRQAVYAVTFDLDPQRLLAQWRKWGAPVTRDLRRMTEPIDLSACLAEVMARLKLLMGRLILDEWADLVESASFILRFHAPPAGRAGIPTICQFDEREDGSILAVRFIEPPLSIATDVMEQWG